MPHLQELVERHKDDPFVLLGVNFADSEADFRNGVKEHKVTWPTIFQGSEGGQPSSAISKLFEVRGYPTYFLIGPDGKIVGKNLYGEAIDKAIAKEIKAIKEKGKL